MTEEFGNACITCKHEFMHLNVFWKTKAFQRHCNTWLTYRIRLTDLCSGSQPPNCLNSHSACLPLRGWYLKVFNNNTLLTTTNRTLLMANSIQLDFTNVCHWDLAQRSPPISLKRENKWIGMNYFLCIAARDSTTDVLNNDDVQWNCARVKISN